MSIPPKRDEPQVLLSVSELASAAELSPGRLAALIEFGLVEPATPEGTTFTAATAYRLRRMVRIHVDLGVSFIGASIIVDLLERIDRLERRRFEDEG